MKKLQFIFIALLFVSSNVAKGQNLIAVQNGGTAAFYTNLDSAVVHAHDGDTIYLSGGSFPLTVKINKCLHIIGVGHNPDSTNVTASTLISVQQYLFLVTGASGGSLTGVKLSGGITFGTDVSDANVSNYSVYRCLISWLLFQSIVPANNVFYENIIGGLSLQNAQSNAFYNNILLSYNYDIGAGNIFKNNVFTPGGGYILSNTNNSIFMNNVFRATGNTVKWTDCLNNIFNNNLFVENINPGSNNIFNQAQSSIFVNYSGSGTFSYTEDYHLKSTCPGKNAGTDGTDIGIYGGAFPWKEGSVPFNPHIIKSTINGTTNTSGGLPVNIKVGAQDH